MARSGTSVAIGTTRRSLLPTQRSSEDCLDPGDLEMTDQVGRVSVVVHASLAGMNAVEDGGRREQARGLKKRVAVRWPLALEERAQGDVGDTCPRCLQRAGVRLVGKELV